MDEFVVVYRSLGLIGISNARWNFLNFFGGLLVPEGRLESLKRTLTKFSIKNINEMRLNHQSQN